MELAATPKAIPIMIARCPAVLNTERIVADIPGKVSPERLSGNPDVSQVPA